MPAALDAMGELAEVIEAARRAVLSAQVSAVGAAQPTGEASDGLELSPVAMFHLLIATTCRQMRRSNTTDQATRYALLSQAIAPPLRPVNPLDSSRAWLPQRSIHHRLEQPTHCRHPEQCCDLPGLSALAPGQHWDVDQSA